MKKILGLMLLCAMSISVSAQTDASSNNAKCWFSFSTGEFISQQGQDGFVVYEVAGMSASELKASAYTVLSSMYKSPKDVITTLSDNMIQLEGYAAGIYGDYTGDTYYRKDVQFNLVIQFKDGKVRYNTPTIKQIYSEWPLSGMARFDMSKPLSVLVKDASSRQKVEDYFSKLIYSINSQLEKSNDW